MPRKKKKEEAKQKDPKLSLDRWRSKIQWHKQRSENAVRSRNFDTLEEEYRGNYTDALKLDTMRTVPVNEVFSYVKTSIANLYIRDPYITVNPTKRSDILPAFIQEQVINNDWRRLKMKKHAKHAIQESKLVGRGWIKIGYKAEGPLGYIETEDIWATFVPWRQILYDSRAIDPPYDCRWIAQFYQMPTEILNERYPGKDIKPTEKIHSRDNKVKLKDEDVDMSILYEIWDKDTGYKLVYTDGYEEGWLEMIPPVEKGAIGPYVLPDPRFPFYLLKFNDIFGKDDNFPISTTEVIQPQIEEKIKLRSMELNHIKRHSRQILYRKDVMDKATLDLYEKGVDGAALGVETSAPLDDVVKPVGYASIQPEIYSAQNNIDIDRDKISGQSQLEQGAPVSTKTRTLGELRAITAGTGNRKTEEIDVVEDFLEEIASGLMALQQKFYDTERYVEIIGEIPVKFLQVLAQQGKFDGRSIKFTKKDIQGEFSRDIKIGSTIPINKQNRMEIILQAIRFGPALGLTPGSNAANALGRLFFQDLDMIEIEEAYKRDLAELEAAKQQGPSKEQQLKEAKQVQDLARGKSDKELKDVRIQKNKMDLIKDGIELVLGEEGNG